MAALRPQCLVFVAADNSALPALIPPVRMDALLARIVPAAAAPLFCAPSVLTVRSLYSHLRSRALLARIARWLDYQYSAEIAVQDITVRRTLLPRNSFLAHLETSVLRTAV